MKSTYCIEGFLEEENQKTIVGNNLKEVKTAFISLKLDQLSIVADIHSGEDLDALIDLLKCTRPCFGKHG